MSADPLAPARRELHPRGLYLRIAARKASREANDDSRRIAARPRVARPVRIHAERPRRREPGRLKRAFEVASVRLVEKLRRDHRDRIPADSSPELGRRLGQPDREADTIARERRRCGTANPEIRLPFQEGPIRCLLRVGHATG